MKQTSRLWRRCAAAAWVEVDDSTWVVPLRAGEASPPYQLADTAEAIWRLLRDDFLLEAKLVTELSSLSGQDIDWAETQVRDFLLVLEHVGLVEAEIGY